LIPSTALRGWASFLQQVAVIDLPGPPGKGFDYLRSDGDDHYLFSVHLGAGNLYVIDSP